MTNPASIRTARRIFSIAAIYGVIVLLPVYFAAPRMAKAGHPVIHLELLYGFVGTALCFQLIYWMIGRDPVRYRPLMPITWLAKLSFAIPCAILYATGRLDGTTFTLSMIDFVIALAFFHGWRITRDA
jgi:hypothetical protein